MESDEGFRMGQGGQAKGNFLAAKDVLKRQDDCLRWAGMGSATKSAAQKAVNTITYGHSNRAPRSSGRIGDVGIFGRND